MSLAAPALLGSLIICRLAEGDVGAGTNLGLGAVAAVEGLAGDDSVDFYAGQY